MGSLKKRSFQSEGPCHRYPSAVLCLCCRKLRATLDEYTTRVGQQAIVLCISPSKPNPVFKVFGAAPLENVVGVCRSSSVITRSAQGSLQVGFKLLQAGGEIACCEGSAEVLAPLHKLSPGLKSRGSR